MLLSMALTSLLTGVTEPIEFSFMFLAPALYALHALLTGVVHGHHGCAARAAGLRLLRRPVRLCAQLQQGDAARCCCCRWGLATSALYYGLFRFVIARFDLKTPAASAEAALPARGAPADRAAGRVDRRPGRRGEPGSVDACTTRLRLVVADQAAVDEPP